MVSELQKSGNGHERHLNTTDFAALFQQLLERRVQRLSIRGVTATGLCPFHDDHVPSFSARIDRGVWYCHACQQGGGVKKFAELVGEPWAVASLSRPDRQRVAVSLRRRAAEQEARAILRRWEEDRLDVLCVEWREAHRDAALALELLALFHRRPALEEEFSHLAAQAAREYGAATHRRVFLEAEIDGEVER